MKRNVAILTLLMLISFSTKAQNDTLEKPNPKIGLVLSGGGAKGLAHIGVLKTIDSLGIKIDYISGTSMGAVIGSLYASGYSGKELEKIFNGIDFDKLIGDDLPRASKTFYERENFEKYAISIPFNNFKIQLPSAISRGQNVFNLFSKLTLHVSDIENFENLPIPFLCIATNVETGKPVVLNEGSLAQAIAASGAFPSLFQPVTINNQILIDGGVVNNYPIDELKAKGMDIIIGVDVQDDLSTRENLKSAPEILLQINNYRTIKDMKEKSTRTDIYIKPDIKEFTVVSFDDGEQIIKRGEAAAIKSIKALKELATENTKPKYSIAKIDSIKINNIFLSGNEKYTRAYVLGKLKIKANEKTDYREFTRGVNNLVATNNFDSFLYQFKPKNDGHDLLATLKESDTKTYLKLGAHYDDLYKSAALINLTQKRLLLNNDVATLDIILGDNIRYNLEYYIDKGFYWSIGLRSRFNTFHKDISASLLLSEVEIATTGLNKLDIELKDFTNQFYLQTLFRKDLSLMLGAEHKKLQITSETIVNNPNPNAEETTFENSDFLSLFGKLKFDTYSHKYFPKSGFLFDSDFHLYLSSSDFNNNFAQFSFAKANIGYAFSLSSKFSIILSSEGGFRIGDNSNQSLSFALGGYGNNFINNFISFYGYDHISIIGDSFVKGLINMDYEFVKNHHFNFSANYANVDDNIFTDGEWITTPDYSGYALGYGFDTIIGPIEAKYTWSPETSQSKWFFNIGFWF
ncbi:patatin-like phospholipase family protein [Pontimicrobium sp. SW4]|uniref:Patatin-like phospholipase family protein n=1 Tax=Pontimicrobium sp. SW4 TaxID=3153519 RepID=A0AAU7BSR8_9FLAO